MPLFTSSIPRLHRRPEAWVAACAFAVRLFVLVLFSKSPHFGVQSGDMGFYQGWAAKILAGQWTDHHAFYGLPGYAFLLAAFYAVVGIHPAAILFLQAVMDSLTAAIIFIIARKTIGFERKAILPHRTEILSTAAPLLAAIGWIFFLPAITFTNILMPTAWMIFVFWFCVWLVLPPGTIRHPLGWGILGLLIGLVATLVATILFLLPLVVAAIWNDLAPEHSVIRRGKIATCRVLFLFGGLFLGASPVWIHNYFIAKDPVALSAHGGINFWIGNSPEANGYPKIPKGLPAGQEPLLRASITQAETNAGHPLLRSQVSAYWSRKAWAEIRSDPARWIRLLGIKVRNFWNAYSYDDLTIIALFRKEHVLPPGWGFGPIAALGLAGMVVGIIRNSPCRWVAAAVLLQMAALMPVFITERYRMAAVPGLLILGSYGLWWAASKWRMYEWKGLAIYGLLLLAASAAVFLPKTDAPRAMEPFNLAIAEMEVGQNSRAEGHLNEAAVFAPNDPSLLLAMGNLWLQKGDHPKAKSYYRQVLNRDPSNPEALTNAAVLAMEESRWAIARDLLANASRSRPEDPDIYYLLARTDRELGRTDIARSDIEAALRLAPARREFLDFRAKLAAAP